MESQLAATGLGASRARPRPAIVFAALIIALSGLVVSALSDQLTQDAPGGARQGPFAKTFLFVQPFRTGQINQGSATGVRLRLEFASDVVVYIHEGKHALSGTIDARRFVALLEDDRSANGVERKAVLEVTEPPETGLQLALSVHRIELAANGKAVIVTARILERFPAWHTMATFPSGTTAGARIDDVEFGNGVLLVRFPSATLSTLLFRE